MTRLYQSEYLRVSEIHKIYFETYGNPNGIPVLFIHGGPGGTSKQKVLSEINTDHCFAILFDQRGCGKSLPFGELLENNTENLINDIKLLLDHLSIKETVIYAGSWGACLGLLFAENYPKMVLKMFLNCSFLARKDDACFLYHGVKEVFPDLHSEFMEKIPLDYHEKPSNYLYNEMLKGNIVKSKEIACLIANYEISLMTITFSKSNYFKPEDMTDEDIIPSLIFLHYDSNNFFIKGNQIIDNAEKIKDIEICFIHGRYDMDAPLSGVWNLHKKLPKSELTIIPYEGHSGELKKSLLIQNLNNYLKSHKK